MCVVKCLTGGIEMFCRKKIDFSLLPYEKARSYPGFSLVVVWSAERIIVVDFIIPRLAEATATPFIEVVGLAIAVKEIKILRQSASNVGGAVFLGDPAFDYIVDQFEIFFRDGCGFVIDILVVFGQDIFHIITKPENARIETIQPCPDDF